MIPAVLCAPEQKAASSRTAQGVDVTLAAFGVGKGWRLAPLVAMGRK
jgi:hypothetical protein